MVCEFCVLFAQESRVNTPLKTKKVNPEQERINNEIKQGLKRYFLLWPLWGVVWFSFILIMVAVYGGFIGGLLGQEWDLEWQVVGNIGICGIFSLQLIRVFK